MKKKLLAGLATGLLVLIYSQAHATPVISVLNDPTLIGIQQQTPGWSTAQGAYQAYDTTNNIAYNGVTPVVSSNLPGYDPIHDESNINDGYYGNGSSWIGNSANSWLKIDLSSNFYLDSILFGRDRLGYYNDRDPGQFTIEVALTDDLFANGNISNDGIEYATIVDSSLLSFSGVINGNDSILTSFTPIEARFIKMTFANNGAAIDEIEVSRASVPEPSTYLLFVSGLMGLVWYRKKQGNV